MKKICAIILSLTLFFSAFMSVGVGAEVSTGEETDISDSIALNVFSSAEERLTAMTLVKSAGGTELYVDKTNADIAVVDIESGAMWFSSPINISGDVIASETLQQHMASQLRISLLDASNGAVELLSYRDCIQNGQFEIKEIKNGIELDMVLGREEQRRLAPEALPASSMEKYILPKLEGRALKKIEYFYKKYEADEMSEKQLKEISEKYPLVSSEPIYVLKSVTDTEAQEIEGYIKQTDYTFELMEGDLEELGTEITETASPYVKLKISYTVKDSGEFKASIDCGSIEYNKESFVLNKMYFLEYFASEDAVDESGFIVLPDGSGAVMNFNSERTKTNTELTIDIYGRDMALSYTNQAVTNEAAVLPAYAISSAKGSMLTFIENGAENSSVKASSGGTNTSLATVSSVLNFCDVDYFDYTEIGTANTWVISDKTGYSGKYDVIYKLLPQNSSYSLIASACRDVMSENGHLKKSENSADTSLNIGLYGAVDYLDRVLFMPVNRLIPLTDAEDVRTIADDLKNHGIEDIDLRYIGWSSGGLKNSVANANVLRVLSTKKEMRELSLYLEDNNIGFYPDFNFQTVYKNTLFDGFSPAGDAVRMLNRQYANYYKMDMASNGQDNSTQIFLLNAEKMTDLFEKTAPKFKVYESNGISLSKLGSLLYSDKNSKASYGREAAKNSSIEIFEKASADYSIMLEGGNSYSWNYADKIIGLPGNAGGYAQTDYAIPFVQMVLHGYIPYTSNPINISGNIEQEFLKAAEVGSQLYFELTAQNGAKLKTTDFSAAYSTDYSNWSGTVKDYYEKWNSVFADLGDKTITDHQILAEGVTVTVYSDGTQVVVNYTNEVFEYGQTQIPPRDFLAI